MLKTSSAPTAPPRPIGNHHESTNRTGRRRTAAMREANAGTVDSAIRKAYIAAGALRKPARAGPTRAGGLPEMRSVAEPEHPEHEPARHREFRVEVRPLRF